MNKRICIIILLFTFRICNAQNLVPNGDFEQYIGCPSGNLPVDSALYWMNPCLNSMPSNGSPDYFNSCNGSVPNNFNGYQPGHSGSAYAGIMCWYSVFNFREYIEVPLTSTLISDTCYHFEMYINLANTCTYTINNIGAYFSDTVVDGITNSNTLLFNPQIINTLGFVSDTLNWTLISGDFTASGGENYLIIGNFNSDLNTDTFRVQIGVPGWNYFYVDDVSLIQIPCNTGIEEQNENTLINIYPNPAMDKLNVTVNNNDLSEIILYDMTSRKLLQQQFTNSVSLNTEQLAKGLYLYEVRSKDGSCKKGKVVKD